MGRTGGVQVGDVLAGKYRVESVLGQGGMGIVVRAVHLHLRDHVAIKLLLPDADQGEARTRFLREARAAARIKNVHVVRVVDFGVLEDDSPMMVMEYLEGRDLASVLEKEGPLPIAAAVEYVLQACEAVAAAHALGIVHRDLKPSNLFLANDGQGGVIVKVLDFGISKVTSQQGDAEHEARITNTNAILGSPQYMSPEQLRGQEVDVRTDVWSLGVILQELVTRRTPFRGMTLPEIAGAILHEPPRPLSDDLVDPPPALQALLLSALEKSRERRIESVEALARALSSCVPTSASRASLDSVLRISGSGPHAVVARSGAISEGRTAAATDVSPLAETAAHTSGEVPTASLTHGRLEAPTRTPRWAVPAAVVAALGLVVATFGLNRAGQRETESASGTGTSGMPAPVAPAATTVAAAGTATGLPSASSPPGASSPSSGASAEVLAAPGASGAPAASSAARPGPRPGQRRRNVLDERE